MSVKDVEVVKTGTPVLQTGMKILSAIEVLAAADDGLTVTSLAEKMEWTRAAAHQYLQTIVAAGWAYRDESSQYRISFHVAQLVAKVNPAKEIRPILIPAMQEAVDQLGAPVSLAVLEQMTPLIVERIEPARAMFIRKGFEARVSPTSSASGQILLAYSEDARREISRFETILAEEEYERIYEQGYSIVHSKWLGDLITAVAVPVRKDGICFGALSVITERGAETDGVLIDAMLNAAEKLNARLATESGQ